MSTGNETRGIIVLGAPRSGTTLVRRLINAHSNIASPGETCLFTACARFLHNEVVADGVEFGVLSGLAFAGVDEATVLDRLRNFAFETLRDIADSQGKKRWAEKTAVDIFHLPNIERLLGDSVQYVFVVRHGLDVACSMEEFSNRGFTYLAELHDFVKSHPRPLEAFAHAWVEACRAMQAFRADDPKRAYVIRYEELISDTESQLRSLFDFLGENVEDGIIDAAMQRPKSAGFGDWKSFSRKGIDGSSVQRWKSLPPNTLRRLADICNPTLDELGYEPVKTRAGDNQAAARRKYEFSLLLDRSKKD